MVRVFFFLFFSFGVDFLYSKKTQTKASDPVLHFCFLRCSFFLSLFLPTASLYKTRGKEKSLSLSLSLSRKSCMRAA